MPEQSIKWRLPDRWTVIQSGCQRVVFDVSQDGNTLIGTAQRGPDGIADDLVGSFSGSIDGNDLHITVYWPNNSIEIYSGTVGPEGKVEGTTGDLDDRAPIASWCGESTLSDWD